MNDLPFPAQMNLDDIDKALADWRGKLSVCTQNLLALDDLYTYKRLKGTDGLPAATLTGITSTRVPAALDAIVSLFDNLQTLTNIVDRATTIRLSIPRMFVSEQNRRKIEQILSGPSIELPPIETPLAQRGLLSETEKPSSITPSQLLDQMMRKFEAAKVVIMEVDGAWSRLEPELGAITTEATQLIQASKGLDETDLPELMSIQYRVNTLRDSIETDPLGADADVRREITPLLEAARSRITEIAGQRSQVMAALKQARNDLDALEQMQRENLEAIELCNQLVQIQSAKSPPSLNANAPAELRAWLTTLGATFEAGNIKPVRFGLSRWNTEAQAALAAAKSSRDYYRAPVELLAELRGRLAAQKLRAQTAASRGVKIDPALATIAANASSLLDATPSPVEAASQLVTEYERRLRECLKV